MPGHAGRAATPAPASIAAPGRAHVAAHRHRRAPPARPARAARRGPARRRRSRRPAARAAPAARAPGRRPSARRPAGSNAVARERPVQRRQRGAAGDAAARAAAARSPSLTPSGSPNSSSSRRWGESGASASSDPEPEQAGDRHGGAGVGADPRVAGGQRDQAGRQPARRPAAPSSSGAPASAASTRPGQQAVRERLGRVAQPLAQHPEAERAAEAARQHDLERARAARCRSSARRASVLVVLDVTARAAPGSSSTISSRP